MRIAGEHRRTIGLNEADGHVWIIDQVRLPHQVEIALLKDLEEAAHAIKAMRVRGAPLIGGAAAYGLYLAMRMDASDAHLQTACERLMATRPTAVNLRWAIERVSALLRSTPVDQRVEAAKAEAARICDEDVEICRRIGDHGLALIRQIAENNGGSKVNILTHCNAGWLATIDWGTATAPIYRAQEEGIDVHVWVDETRPRNQGAFLTAFELLEQGVDHTLIVDSAAGHVMQRGMVDACLVGTDRTTAAGDVCNKIGTYTKALAARDNDIPFYVALPSTTIDWTIDDGVRDVPIEQRDPEEVSWMQGRTASGEVTRVQLPADGTHCANFAFDVTPARLVTKLITERGVCDPDKASISALFQAV